MNELTRKPEPNPAMFRPNESALTVNTRMADKRHPGKVTLDQLCRLLKVPTSEKWDEDNADNFLVFEDGMNEEDTFKAEEELRTEAWGQYRGAVVRIALQVFDHHGLELDAICPHKNRKLGFGPDDAWEFRIKPNPGRTWKDCAANVMTTINGMGPFHFATLKEFLSSGPYTAREAVLQHIGWIPDWYDVYEGGKAANRVYRVLR